MILDKVKPAVFIWVGLVLLIIGVILPMLMVMDIVESTLFWNFFSWISSFLGLQLGIIGAVTYTVRRRRRRE